MTACSGTVAWRWGLNGYHRVGLRQIRSGGQARSPNLEIDRGWLCTSMVARAFVFSDLADLSQCPSVYLQTARVHNAT
jgi:hypothetical protein